MRLKKLAIAITIMFFLILLVLTNPSKEHFTTWVKEELTKEMKGGTKVLVNLGFVSSEKS